MLKYSFFKNNYSSMFQNLENRNSPTQPDMKQTSDKTNSK